MKRNSWIVLAILISGLLVSCDENNQSSGDKFFKSGEFEKAVEAYTSDLEYKPNDVRMLYNRGRAYEEISNFEMAKADFEHALNEDPNNFQVLLSLANLHHKEKNYTNALFYANKAAEIPGAPAMASFMKARALHQLGKPEEALKAYDNAIHLDEGFGQAYFNRGLLKIAMKNVKGACGDLQLASGLEYKGSAEAYAKYCK
jgi:tetratricopeptide (TPR) repeat protein